MWRLLALVCVADHKSKRQKGEGGGGGGNGSSNSKTISGLGLEIERSMCICAVCCTYVSHRVERISFYVCVYVLRAHLSINIYNMLII